MNTETLPWYRHGWVWFVIALPASVLVASFFLLWVAFSHPSSLVREDYYRDGLGINRRLEQAHVARERKLGATLEFERETGTLRVRVSSTELPAQLALSLLHPTDAQGDAFLVLERSAPGVWETRLPAAPNGRRHLQLGEGETSAWLLQGTWDPRASAPTVLRPADN